MSKAKPNQSWESKGAKKEFGADLFKGLQQQMEATLQGITSHEELRARNLEHVLQQQIAQTVIQFLQRSIGLQQASAQQEAKAEDTIPADSSSQAKHTERREVGKQV